MFVEKKGTLVGLEQRYVLIVEYFFAVNMEAFIRCVRTVISVYHKIFPLTDDTCIPAPPSTSAATAPTSTKPQVPSALVTTGNANMVKAPSGKRKRD